MRTSLLLIPLATLLLAGAWLAADASRARGGITAQMHHSPGGPMSTHASATNAAAAPVAAPPLDLRQPTEVEVATLALG